MSTQELHGPTLYFNFAFFLILNLTTFKESSEQIQTSAEEREINTYTTNYQLQFSKSLYRGKFLNF